ncbi:MAG: SIR2 family protein [Chitinophaga sp.]|uniref:SIR2 family protein n=1 Tax=Chitinophaga sp. TaxID=1869181 RepID=UPI001B095ED8|nr:SIR2 family protein [Chitinophaga sp.]MBO9733190.1 SIR2 family protein [Chitinophaga sp.]
MPDFKQSLATHLSQFKTNPYIFVGSGLSRRYYNLPTWMDLLRGFFPNMHGATDFNYYISQYNGHAPQIASAMANDFFDIWWKNPAFAKRTKALGGKMKGKHSPFKYELCEYLKTQSKVNVALQTEIDLFKKIVVDGIITTNYDDFLEQMFPDFKPYIGQRQLLFAEFMPIGEIYKIHGCISDYDSIVLTHEDYTNFNDRNAYLAAKLLTIFVEHPIIFLGYSITDENINEILDAIIKCLDGQNAANLKDRLIFVEWDKTKLTPELSDSTLFRPGNQSLQIKKIALDSFSELFEVLASAKRQYSVKLLRQFKDAVVQIVKTNGPSNKMYVGDVDGIDEENIQFVAGVGIADQAVREQGYVGVQFYDIFKDILSEKSAYLSTPIVEKVLPNLVPARKNNTKAPFIPMCRYLADLGYFDENGVLTADGVVATRDKIAFRNDMPKSLLPSGSYQNHKPQVNRRFKSLTELLESQTDFLHILYYIPLLDRKKIDLEVLRKWLLSELNEKNAQNTHYRKIVCYYDYLKHAFKA